MHVPCVHMQVHVPILPLHTSNCVFYNTYLSSPSNATCSEHPSNLGDLSGQSDHLAESVVVAGLRLGQLHVGALKALVQHVHDLGSNVADVRVLYVIFYQYTAATRY
jgi:hypothetical protein